MEYQKLNLSNDTVLADDHLGHIEGGIAGAYSNADTAVAAHNASPEAHQDIRLVLRQLADRINTVLDSDDTTLDELSEIVAYIKSNKTLIDAITTSKVNVADVVNNLTSNAANKPLSAAQGVALKALIDAITVPTKLSELGEDASHRVVTDAEKKTWNGKSNFSGNYNDLDDSPTKVSYFQNDAGYLTEHQDISGKLDANKLPEAVENALAQAKESGEFDGEDGRGIVSIARTSGNGAAGTTDTYTITYTDSTTSIISVYNGKNGTNGVSPTVTPSKSGKVTTLTIKDASSTKTATINDGADGYTPQKFVDYWTDADKTSIVQEVNADAESYIVSELAKRGQLKPEFANSIEECTDTSKLYVLPDGYIYGYMMSEGEQFAIEITGETGGYYEGNDQHPTGRFVALASTSAKKTNIIPITPGDKFSYTGFGSSAVYSVLWLDSDKALISREQHDSRKNAVELTAPDGAAYVWFSSFAYSGKLDSVVLSVSWVLCQAAVSEYRWISTGHAFVPADYEDRIVALEKSVEDMEDLADIPFAAGVLYGKKYVACGDSFTAGPFSAKTEETWDNDMGVYKTYPYWIAKRNQMTLVNEAQSGSDFVNADGASNPFSVSRYKAVPQDADYITLMFGLNETGVAIGTKTDSTNATLWGAYNTVFEYFLTTMPFAKIGVIIADAWMTQAYSDALKDICTYWGIPYLDLKADNISMGIGGKYSETSAKAKELRNAAFQVSSSDSHPNPNAHAYRSTIIENFLRGL